MTKQEQRIKDAWIATGKEVTWNSEGWARFGAKQTEFSDEFEEKNWLGYYFYRPKSLSTVEIIEALEDFRIWQEDKPQYDLYPQSDILKAAIEKAILILEAQ